MLVPVRLANGRQETGKEIRNELDKERAADAMPARGG